MSTFSSTLLLDFSFSVPLVVFIFFCELSLNKSIILDLLGNFVCVKLSLSNMISLLSLFNLLLLLSLSLFFDDVTFVILESTLDIGVCGCDGGAFELFDFILPPTLLSSSSSSSSLSAISPRNLANLYANSSITSLNSPFFFFFFFLFKFVSLFLLFSLFISTFFNPPPPNIASFFLCISAITACQPVATTGSFSFVDFTILKFTLDFLMSFSFLLLLLLLGNGGGFRLPSLISLSSMSSTSFSSSTSI